MPTATLPLKSHAAVLTDADVAAEIDRAIDHDAPLLRVRSTGISARAALKAIAHVETEYGRRWEASKHEDSYCYGGPYYRGDGPGGSMGDDVLRELTTRWGCSAHESFGPWQILFITAFEFGFRGDPVRLRIPAVSVEVAVQILNRRLLDRVTDATPRDLFDAWNSGRARDRKVPEDYIRKAMPFYERYAA